MKFFFVPKKIVPKKKMKFCKIILVYKLLVHLKICSKLFRSIHFFLRKFIYSMFQFISSNYLSLGLYISKLFIWNLSIIVTKIIIKFHLYSLCTSQFFFLDALASVSLEYNKGYNFIFDFGIYLWKQLFYIEKEKIIQKDSTPLIFEFYCFDCVKLYCCINQLLWVQA
jgi:hypothetical protein